MFAPSVRWSDSPARLSRLLEWVRVDHSRSGRGSNCWSPWAGADIGRGGRHPPQPSSLRGCRCWSTFCVRSTGSPPTRPKRSCAGANLSAPSPFSYHRSRSCRRTAEVAIRMRSSSHDCISTPDYLPAHGSSARAIGQPIATSGCATEEQIAMERKETIQRSSQFAYDINEQHEFFYPRYRAIPERNEELDAYSAGHRNGVLSGILLGSISGALTVLILWFLFL